MKSMMLIALLIWMVDSANAQTLSGKKCGKKDSVATATIPQRHHRRFFRFLNNNPRDTVQQTYWVNDIPIMYKFYLWPDRPMFNVQKLAIYSFELSFAPVNNWPMDWPNNRGQQ